MPSSANCLGRESKVRTIHLASRARMAQHIAPKRRARVCPGQGSRPDGGRQRAGPMRADLEIEWLSEDRGVCRAIRVVLWITPPLIDDRVRIPAPRQIGRYIVLSQLGEGGMGVVYLAFDPKLERKVALKLVRSTAMVPDSKNSEASGALSDGGTAASSTLLQEAQSLASLDHPNIATVWDVGTLAGGEVFMAMEYIAGRDLNRWLDERARSIEEVFGVLRDVARALRAAHAANIVHRDIKPGNILIGHDDRVYLLDFGLAVSGSKKGESRLGTLDLATELATHHDAAFRLCRRLELIRSELADGTSTGWSVAGTPAFMAPEQFLSAGIDARCDVYAYCLVAYRALYGHGPFADASPGQIWQRVLDGPRPVFPPRRGLSKGLRSVLESGLSLDPSARPDSTQAFIDALDMPDERASLWPKLLLSAVASLAIFAGATLKVQSSQRRDCDRGAQKINRLWGAEQRADLQRKLGSSTQAVSSADLSELTRKFDGFAKEWISAYGEVCADDSLTDFQGDMAINCLGGQASSLGDILQAIRDRGAAAVGPSRRAAGNLPSPSSCAALNEQHLDHHGQSYPPEQIAERSALTRAHERAKIQFTLGDYELAAQMLSAALGVEGAVSPEFEEVPVHLREGSAAILVERGDVARESGRVQLADQFFSAARLMAAAAGRPTIEAWATIQQAFLRGVVIVEHGDVGELLQRAHALVVAAGDDKRTRYAYHTVAGVVLDPETRERDKLAHLRSALQAAIDDVGPRSLQASIAHINLGVTATHLNHFSSAAHHLYLAKSIRLELYDADHPRVGEIERQLGDLQSKIGNWPVALEHRERAVSIFEGQLGPKVPICAMHRKLGIQDALSAGRLELAREQIERARRWGDREITGLMAELALARGALERARALLDLQRSELVGGSKRALGQAAAVELSLAYAEGSRSQVEAGLAELGMTGAAPGSCATAWFRGCAGVGLIAVLHALDVGDRMLAGVRADNLEQLLVERFGSDRGNPRFAPLHHAWASIALAADFAGASSASDDARALELRAH